MPKILLGECDKHFKEATVILSSSEAVIFNSTLLPTKKDNKISKPTVCEGCSQWLIESSFQPSITCSLSKKISEE